MCKTKVFAQFCVSAGTESLWRVSASLFAGYKNDASSKPENVLSSDHERPCWWFPFSHKFPRVSSLWYESQWKAIAFRLNLLVQLRQIRFMDSIHLWFQGLLQQSLFKRSDVFRISDIVDRWQRHCKFLLSSFQHEIERNTDIFFLFPGNYWWY